MNRSFATLRMTELPLVVWLYRSESNVNSTKRLIALLIPDPCPWIPAQPVQPQQPHPNAHAAHQQHAGQAGPDRPADGLVIGYPGEGGSGGKGGQRGDEAQGEATLDGEA